MSPFLNLLPFLFLSRTFSLNLRVCTLEVGAKCMFMSIKLPKLLVVPPLFGVIDDGGGGGGVLVN